MNQNKIFGWKNNAEVLKNLAENSEEFILIIRIFRSILRIVVDVRASVVFRSQVNGPLRKKRIIFGPLP